MAIHLYRFHFDQSVIDQEGRVINAWFLGTKTFLNTGEVPMIQICRCKMVKLTFL
jgi:hypothetical protein